MKSIFSFIKWLAAVAATGALLLAVPMVLILAPSPLDPDRGVRALITALIDGSQIFEESVVSLIVAIGWLLWAYVAASLVVEVVSTAFGVASRNVRVLSFGQSIARPLVGALMWSTTASTMAMSVVGAGGVMAVTTELAHAAEASPAQRSLVDLSQPGHVFVMNGNGDSEGSTKSEPIVINEEDGTMMVDGQLVRPHLVVIKDDTMWDLAETHLLDPFRWPEIAELNLGRPQPNSPIVTDPNLIWPGTILLMPGDAIGLNTPPQAANELPVEEDVVAEAEQDCEVPEVQVWTPESDATTTDPNDSAATPFIGSDDSDGEVSTAGRDEISLGTQLPWWWLAAAGGAGAVFAAGMVRLIAKRRDRDQALGLGVEEIDELEELLEDFDEPQPDLRAHLLTAATSLRESLVGVDAPLLQVDADKTTAVFTEVVRPAGDSVWSLSAEDGERAVWELPHSEDAVFDRDAAGSPLYGVGDNMFLNLEAIGWLGIEGEPDLVASHLRHLVHDLVGNFGQQHEFVLRVGGPGMIMGADVYSSVTETSVEAMRAEVSEYIRQADEHHNGRGTNLAAELRQGDGDGLWPSLVLILDIEQVDYLGATIEPLHRFPGRYPISVVSVGVSSGAPWMARVNSPAEMVIDTTYFSQAPRVKPQLMSESTAEALAAELRGQLSTKRWVPKPTDPAEPVVTDDVEQELDWFENVMDEYFDDSGADKTSALNGSHRPDDECVYENPLPGKRLPYEPPEREVADIINPRFTPDQLAGLRDFAPDEATTDADLLIDSDELDDDEEVNKVMASQPAAGPQLQLLGRPGITGISGDVSQRCLATAVLLALSPQGLDRAKIRELIWDGRDVDLRQVRKVLTDLQNSVGNCLGRVLDNDSLITLTIDTDLDEIERRVQRASTMQWAQASALLADTLELVSGEPLEDVAFHKWWNWVDNHGGQIRQQILERAETALTTAGEQAQAESDWQLLRSIGEAGHTLSKLSHRMTKFAALGAAMTGHADHAMTIVVKWEDDYESLFDEPAPNDLRQQIVKATRQKLAR